MFREGGKYKINENDIVDMIKKIRYIPLGRENSKFVKGIKRFPRFFDLKEHWDETFFQQPAQSVQPKPVLSREDVEEAMVTYMERAFKEDGCPWYAIARHMLGLYHGQRGGRLWRQVWSNHKLKPQPPRDVMAIAREALARGAEVPA